MRVSLREIREVVRSALRESGSDPRALAKDVLLKGDREAFIVLQDAMEESDPSGAGAALRNGSILIKLKVLTGLAAVPFKKQARFYHLSVPSLECSFYEDRLGKTYVRFSERIGIAVSPHGECVAGRVIFENADPVEGLDFIPFVMDLFTNGNISVTGLYEGGVTVDREDPRYQELRKQFDKQYVPVKTALETFLSVIL